MLFNSIGFVLFFPAFLLGYYLLPTQKLRNWLIVLGSYFFYMSWEPKFALLLLACSLVTYAGAIIMSRQSTVNSKKYTLALCVTTLALILVAFKYIPFLVSIVNDLAALLGFGFKVSGLKLLLPLGISFFTFRAISYLVDVYKLKIDAERNFIDFSAYFCFFPQIVSGPIDRATSLLPQLKSKAPFNGVNISSGMKMMLWGYFMKLAFADRAVTYVNIIYQNLDQHNGTSILLASILYSFQLYCDFAGYSLISIGCAKAMGITVADNFNRPYLAVSVSDFWKRWHISLTRWLTDYIYIPLGGSRCSKSRTYINILIVFLVSGVWHGAAWGFIVWGLLHGLILVIEKAVGYSKRKCVNGFEHALRIMALFFVVNIAWVFFYFPNVSDAVASIYKMFTSFGIPFTNPEAQVALEYCGLALVIIVIKELMDEFFPNKFCFLDNRNIVVRYATYIVLTLAILLVGVFDAGQFIYAQF